MTDEPNFFNPKKHEMCPCDRVLKAHCDYFKMDGGIFHDCVYRIKNKPSRGRVDNEDL